MINDFMNIGHIVGEDGHHQSEEAIKALAVSGRGIEPRKFENEELDKLLVVIFVNNFRYRLGKHPNPHAQGRDVLLRVHKALLVYDLKEFSHVSLLTNKLLIRILTFLLASMAWMSAFFFILKLCWASSAAVRGTYG